MKKTFFKSMAILVLFVACMSMGTVSVPAEGPTQTAEQGQLGDITEDGKINALDYMMVKRYVLNTCNLTEAQVVLADVNGDSKVNAVDYMMLKRHVLGTFVIPALRPPVHVHDWKAADCTTPKTCATCGETVGDSIGHLWETATCTSARICESCGETEGVPLGHDWQAASCTEPKTCKYCKVTEGEANGHAWVRECTKPMTCEVCGETQGDVQEHDYANATCTKPKTCEICGKTKGSALGHDYENGKCTRCGEKDLGYKEHVVYGDSPVEVVIDGKICFFRSFDEVSAVIPFKTAEKGYAFTMKDTGSTYTSNGDGKWTLSDGDTCSYAFVSNMFRNKWCRTCGKRAGNGTHGTCVKYLQAMECHQCGEPVKGVVCHTCKEQAADEDPVVYGDSPVVVSINGKEYSFMSFDEVSAVIPFKTAEKGFVFTVKDSGITYTSNGDGSWSADNGYTRSANQVTNMFKNKWCRTCGKRSGNGTHGTCVKYLQATECHQCGEPVKGVVCHTCLK